MNIKHLRKQMKTTMAFALVAASLTGCAQVKAGTVKDEGDLLITTVLKIGRADAIVVQQGGNTMVIDCGEEEDGQELLEYLAKKEVSRIDTLIITHYDKDHVGGADSIVENMEVGRIIVPDYEGTGSEYRDFMVALDELDITPERLNESVSFQLGEALVTVDSPENYEMPDVSGAVEYDNNFSLITTVVHGSNRLLFMGDAEKQRIREFLKTEAATDCDFMKFPHHGVFNSELENLLDATTPEYVAICDSQKNPSDKETLQLLKDKDVTFRQTVSGKIIITSDGAKVEMKQ